MKITYFMVATYIANCVLIRTKPCKYFQLNSPYFNEELGIFSKIDLDKLVPEKWRLRQRIDDAQFRPSVYPVFLKPEWGENAGGIYRVDNEQQLVEYRKTTRNASVRYILQEGATEEREFEIFYMQDHLNTDQYSILTITESLNDTEENPINSINNPDTVYREITDHFDSSQKQTLWQLLGQIGRFGITRISLRADSVEQLLDGNFHVIEINLFTPMPINFLDAKYSKIDLLKFVLKYMMQLARITKYRDKSRVEKPVYSKVMTYNRQNRFINFIREKI